MQPFCGEAITELQDGFVGGDEDCLNWVKHNLQKYNEKNCPPNQAFIASMKTGQQMLMIKQAYATYKEQKLAEKAEEDAEMKNGDAEVKGGDVEMKIETEDKAEAQDPHSPEAVR